MKLKILIEGDPGVGRSVLAWALARFLQSQGFDVDVGDHDVIENGWNLDTPVTSELAAKCGKDVLKYVKVRTITIETRVKTSPEPCYCAGCGMRTESPTNGFCGICVLVGKDGLH